MTRAPWLVVAALADATVPGGAPRVLVLGGLTVVVVLVLALAYPRVVRRDDG